jgi:sugar-specific transcriptional regulator TrmB
MENLYQEVLEKAGLDQKETKVYLSALALKSAPASEIAKKAGITRSTCYGILEILVQKGLVAKSEKPSGIRQFVVDNPELLSAYIERRKANFDQIQAQIKNIIPDLRNMQGEFGFKPEIEYFEGKSGVASGMEAVFPDIKRMAKAKIPLLVHGNTWPLLEAWPKFPEYALKRAKTGVEVRMLIWEKAPPEMKKIQQKHYKVKYLPKKYAYRGGTNILDEKIILFDFDNNFTVVIKNKPLAQMMRLFFEFMWEHVK